MTFELMFTRGPMKNRTMRIPAKGTLRIGAGKDCEITVADPTVSRYHCYVELREGQPWVGDLASDNGLVVNGGVVRECNLDPADVVTVGASEFKVVPVAEKKRRSPMAFVPWLIALGALGVTAWLVLDKFGFKNARPSGEEGPRRETIVTSVTNEVRVVNVTEMTNLTEIVIVRTVVDTNGVRRVETNRVDKVTRKPVPEPKAEPVAPIPENFGPIPNVKYAWWNDKQEPQQVKFQLANGANFEMVPLKKGSFLMSNCPEDGRSYHKVTLSYDYWMSRTLTTVAQLREFCLLDDEGLKQLEAVIPSRYQVCKEISYVDITNFCSYLTRRYRSQIPETYEFRLPTDAEIDRAVRCEEKGLALSPNDNHVAAHSAAKVAFSAITSRTDVVKLGVSRMCNDWPWAGFAGYLITGMGEAHPSGIFDLWWMNAQPILDKYPADYTSSVYVEFGDEEIDPYRICTDQAVSWRKWAHDRWSWRKTPFASPFHVVLGPKMPTGNTSVVRRKRIVPQAVYDWSVPKKLNRPKTLDFKLSNGATMTMCACPGGRFTMVAGVGMGAESSHEATISRPFWITKLPVTLPQYRDFAPYDGEGEDRRIERMFPDNQICKAFPRKRWEAYCEYLTKTYQGQLPPGCVFRLPTEAEWEYAYGDEGVLDIRKRWTECSCNASVNKQSFKKILDEDESIASLGAWSETGVRHTLFVSGRARPNGLGVCDMFFHPGGEEHVLDKVTGACIPYDQAPARYIRYCRRETDPLRWSESANLCMLRKGRSEKWLAPGGVWARAHLVVGPDLVGELQRGERPLGQDEFRDAFSLPIVKAASMREAERGVVRLMADCEKDIRDGKMTRKDAAAKALRFSDNFFVNGKSKPERFLLMKGAFTLAVHGAARDEAMLYWRHIEQTFGDGRRAFMLTNVIHSAYVPYRDERLEKSLAEWTQVAQFAADREKWETVLKDKPRDAEANLGLASALVALGEWDSALERFARVTTKNKELAEVALSEKTKSGKHVWMKLGDFWWKYAEGWPKVSKNAYREHAAELYIKGIVSGQIKEAEKIRCEERIRQARQNAPAKAPHAPEGALYMVVDLSNGPKADYYPVSWLKDVPKGGWTDEYKTTKLVLRRIEPGSFESVCQQTFSVSRPYFIGVFEVTQRQWEQVMGSNPSSFNDDGRKPVMNISYNMVRGSKLGSTWPMSDSVEAECFLGRLRQKSGVTLDLPTEIQWEYACRAGKGGEYDGASDPQMMETLGRYKDNGGYRPDPSGAKDEKGGVKQMPMGPSVVGAYRANAWGLYDFHGNVLERCLDRAPGGGWSTQDGYLKADMGKETRVDPMGCAHGDVRFYRGGSWSEPAKVCRTSMRRAHISSFETGGIGFRLVCPRRK